MPDIKYPMDVIASTSWKLNIPEKNAPEFKVGGKPDLRTYTSSWFYLNKGGVSCKAPPSADAHTSGSKYARSELREMSPDGKTNAAWSSTDGVHSLLVSLSVDAVAKSRPHVVIAQIHDADDDVTVFRFEGGDSNPNVGTLWITDGDTPHGYKLTDNYILGTKIIIGFHVENGFISYIYGEDLVKTVGYTQSRKFKGAYFKTGCYIQNNLGGDDFAIVTLYTVQVCHNGQCVGMSPGDVVVTTTDDGGDTVSRAKIVASAKALFNQIDKLIQTWVDSL